MKKLYLRLLLITNITYMDVSSVTKFLLFCYLINVRVCDSFKEFDWGKWLRKSEDRMILLELRQERQIQV